MNNVIAHLALLLAPGIGIKTRLAWLKQYGSAENVLGNLNALPSTTKQSAGIQALSAIKNKTGSLVPAIKRSLQWAEHDNHHIITLDDPLYPPLLKAITDPPTLLFVVGDPSTLCLPGFAVVGSRKPSPAGKQIAHSLATQIAQHNFSIVSGLAYGIDKAAHEGALSAQATTIGVMATGIDQIYPKAHQGLAHAIVNSGGALITEHPLGASPTRAAFPQRNRIIAGLSTGVLIIEAAIKSGSLITARLGLECNREVYAVPGSILNPLSKGCHQLIKEGAQLVEGIDDLNLQQTELVSVITQHLCAEIDQTEQSTPTPAPSIHSSNLNILQQMIGGGQSVDNLVDYCGLPAEKILQSLMELELEDYIELQHGAYHLTAEGSQALNQITAAT